MVKHIYPGNHSFLVLHDLLENVTRDLRSWRTSTGRARLKSKVGEITMDNELLYAKIAAMEGKRPLAHRRSRR